ncbi:regulator of chromosome condensation 1/beta-lactamase-inhibitor protein II [Thelonectria olida]|uniref:Regulator of chromosome condensation 1/beta-lactamase-inhibitor protein II n=1 Tax=Thelonectria olida TaxID=1576542 RepID=A0A9P9AV08_9HYPO|nr:regulator of chromosome condensation 1/beta-lactamase-inhibitor protein II [Thelonectria olida]
MEVIFALGSNGSGQLGIGHKEDVSVPKQVLFEPAQPESSITRIAAGGNHTLLLTKSGKIFWSGDSTPGACGLASGPDVPVFHEISLTKDADDGVGEVDLIAATWEASVVVAKDADGKRTKVFSFGLGGKGELGLGELIMRTPSASRIKDFPPAGTEVVDIAACMSHVVAVLSNGDAYGWGNGAKGQAGSPNEVIHAPRKIEGVGFKVSRAVCGRTFTCLFGESGSGKIQVLGSDKWGIQSNAPQPAPKWKDVGASWGNVYILTEDGELRSWGRDDHGQLPPPNLPKLSKIAIGSEHVVALSTDGDVLSWGWGEHGNCGPQVDNNDVKGRWNVIASSKFIPPGSKIGAVGAGCATSWVFITAEE